jgi:hypothetical protein
MDKNILIKKCVELIKKAEKEFLNVKDLKAIKYNKITKKLWDTDKEIIKTNEYKEIIKEIIKQTSNNKYMQMHYDIAAFLYNKDKYFALEIYKRYK